MKVSLNGLYDPETNSGLEDVVIMLCRGMRSSTAQKLNTRKAELANNLLQASLNKSDLNVAISNAIPIAVDLDIDFNEINDIVTTNPQIDVTAYDGRYGFGTAVFVIDELRQYGEYPRRLAIITALCEAIFKKLNELDIDDNYESIESDVKSKIKFNGTKIDSARFNQFYYNILGLNGAERILKAAGLYNSEEKPQQRSESVSPRMVSSDPQEQRSGASSPRAALFYFREHSPGLPTLNLPALKRFPSFKGFTPINSGYSSEANSRAQSPTSPISPASFDSSRSGSTSPFKIKRA